MSFHTPVTAARARPQRLVVLAAGFVELCFSLLDHSRYGATPQGPLSCGDALVDGCPIRSISGIGNRPWRATGSHYSRRVRWRIPPLLGVLTNSAFGANFSAMVNQSDTGHATGHSSIDPRRCITGSGCCSIWRILPRPGDLASHARTYSMHAHVRGIVYMLTFPWVEGILPIDPCHINGAPWAWHIRCFDCQCHLRFAAHRACVSVRGGKIQFTQFARHR